MHYLTMTCVNTEAKCMPRQLKERQLMKKADSSFADIYSKNPALAIGSASGHHKTGLSGDGIF